MQALLDFFEVNLQNPCICHLKDVRKTTMMTGRFINLFHGTEKMKNHGAKIDLNEKVQYLFC